MKTRFAQLSEFNGLLIRVDNTLPQSPENVIRSGLRFILVDHIRYERYLRVVRATCDDNDEQYGDNQFPHLTPRVKSASDILDVIRFQLIEKEVSTS